MNNHILNRNRILAVALILTLLTTACGSKIKSPLANIKTGPTQTTDIQVPLPEETSTSAELNLEFVAGELKLAPGASESLASGTATYNAADFTPRVEGTGSYYTVRAGDLKIEGILTCPDNIINTWDLQLANTPMSLNIDAGPYDGTFELGGLALEKLAIDEVGSILTGTFSAPNQVIMSSLTFTTGGSTTVLTGLANANFEQMNFNSGAGDYTLSFDGELQRDADVTIESGAATVTIIVPKGVNAQVTFDGGLTGINTDDGWVKSENIYILSGSGPTITILVKMGIGTLNLKTG